MESRSKRFLAVMKVGWLNKSLASAQRPCMSLTNIFSNYDRVVIFLESENAYITVLQFKSSTLLLFFLHQHQKTCFQEMWNKIYFWKKWKWSRKIFRYGDKHKILKCIKSSLHLSISNWKKYIFLEVILVAFNLHTDCNMIWVLNFYTEAIWDCNDLVYIYHLISM